MVIAAPCPLCEGDGHLGFRLCSDDETMVIVCDGCAHVWMDPVHLRVEHACDPLRPDFRRHYPRCALVPSRWATREEVDAYGWGLFVPPSAAAPAGDDPS